MWYDLLRPDHKLASYICQTQSWAEEFVGVRNNRFSGPLKGEQVIQLNQLNLRLTFWETHAEMNS